jgi:hypothetical protein
MSFIAKLNLDGEEMNVLHCGFRFSQGTDATGKPVAIPRGGAIQLTVESDANTELFETKSGSIVFFKRDNMNKLKKLEFLDAHCIDYYETFDHVGTSPMQIQLRISAREIKLNSSEFKNNWPE